MFSQLPVSRQNMKIILYCIVDKHLLKKMCQDKYYQLTEKSLKKKNNSRVAAVNHAATLNSEQ